MPIARAIPFLSTVVCRKYICVILQIRIAQRQILTNEVGWLYTKFLSIDHLSPRSATTKVADRVQQTFQSFCKYHCDRLNAEVRSASESP